MLNAYIPDGALSAESEAALLSRLTDLLMKHEGADPSNPAARQLAKVWLHRPAAVFHAGERADEPHYQIVPRSRRASSTTSVVSAWSPQ